MAMQAPVRYIEASWVDKLAGGYRPPPPLRASGNTPQDKAAAGDPLSAESGRRSDSTAGVPHVLIVDDEDVIRDAMRELFEDEGFSVVGDCSNGVEAVQAATSLRPEVVLMDLRMPLMGGLEATARIKQGLPDVEVIVLTAYDDPALKADAIEAGAYCFMPKGSSVSLLLQTVRGAFARSRDRTERS